MWSDEENPRPAPPDVLPAALRHRYRVNKRPHAVRLLPAGAAILGAFVALCITVVLTSGVCLGQQANCSAIGEQTAFFCLFTVPLGIAIGAVKGGMYADRLTR